MQGVWKIYTVTCCTLSACYLDVILVKIKMLAWIQTSTECPVGHHCYVVIVWGSWMKSRGSGIVEEQKCGCMSAGHRVHTVMPCKGCTTDYCTVLCGRIVTYADVNCANWWFLTQLIVEKILTVNKFWLLEIFKTDCYAFQGDSVKTVWLVVLARTVQDCSVQKTPSHFISYCTVCKQQIA